jgi:hypothetical protein
MTGEEHASGVRGLQLLSAHCRSLDPAVPTARERLDRALGPELARVLVFALASTGESALGRAV